MNHSEELQHIFEKSLHRAVEKLQTEYASHSTTDLFVYPHPEAGEFSVMNDEHVVLDKVAVHSWTESDELNEEAELEISEPILKSIMIDMSQDGCFDKLPLQKPFSVVMVGDDMETLSELLFLDDDTVSLDENLLKQVDQDLNDFFKKLMSN